MDHSVIVRKNISIASNEIGELKPGHSCRQIGPAYVIKSLGVVRIFVKTFL